MSAQNLPLLQERQFGIITDLFPNFPPTTTTQSTDSTTSSSPSTTSSSLSTSSSSSTTSSSTSTPSNVSSSSSSSSPSSKTSISVSTTSTFPPAVIVTTVAGHTVTSTAAATSVSPSATLGAEPTPTAFLQNQVLSGVVFGLAGLIGLTILIAIATCAIRRRRNRRLIQEAVKFDPVGIPTNYDDRLENGIMEKPRFSSSNGHEPDIQSSTLFTRPYPTRYMPHTSAAAHGQSQSPSYNY